MMYQEWREKGEKRDGTTATGTVFIIEYLSDSLSALSSRICQGQCADAADPSDDEKGAT
jgi:hypothetical protein